MPDREAIDAMIALARRHGLDWVTYGSLWEGKGWPEMPPRVQDTPPVMTEDEPPEITEASLDAKKRKRGRAS